MLVALLSPALSSTEIASLASSHLIHSPEFSYLSPDHWPFHLSPAYTYFICLASPALRIEAWVRPPRAGLWPSAADTLQQLRRVSCERTAKDSSSEWGTMTDFRRGLGPSNFRDSWYIKKCRYSKGMGGGKVLKGLRHLLAFVKYGWYIHGV